MLTLFPPSPRGRASALVAVLLLALGASPAEGQVVEGMVAEQLSLAAVPGASVVLFRVLAAGELEPVAMTVTDEDGVFRLDAPGPGVYRVQADRDGLSSPLSPEMEVTEERPRDDVALIIPSALLQAALTCALDAGEGTAAVVGVVRDPESGVSLPGTRVVATWNEGRMVRRLEDEADGGGRYRVCPPADAGRVAFQTYLLGRWEHHPELDIRGSVLAIHDLDVVPPAALRGPVDVIQERVLQEAAARSLVDLRGEIRDRDTQAPLRYASVTLVGSMRQAVTDEAGRFALGGLLPGRYTMEVRSLGYQAVSEPVELPPGMDVFLGLRVAPEAVEIEGLTVTARPAAAQAIRVTPFRRNIAYGEIMAREEEQGARAFETLRRSAPGIRVSERYAEGGGTQLCITAARRVESGQAVDPTFQLLSQRGNPCPNVQVVVDGMRIPDGPEFLLRTPASEIESIEFLSPLHAQIQYGIGGDTANGVVVVYTRGKGPYASPLRNRER